jgi:hypothetical protein
MNDDELRLLIRAAVQRHMSADGVQEPIRLKPDASLPMATAPSMSFAQYRIDRPAGDTMCIIEENVQCNHCGFCKCHGH